MDGHEQVRLMATRLVHALPQADVVVTVANQHRTHAGFVPHQPGELAPDGEHHVLLTGAMPSVRAGVLPAVAGVNGDDDFPRAAGPRRDRRLGRAAVSPMLQVNHETMAVVLIGLQQKALGPQLLLQVEHDPQILPIAGRAAHAGEPGALNVEIG